MHRIATALWVLVALITVTNQGVFADGPPLDVAEVVTKEAMMPKGFRYKATVPDTLDLAEQARLSINALIGNMDPQQHYGVYQSFSLRRANPAHPSAITWNITVKNARTLPTLRVMNGDTFGLDAEYGMLRALLSQVRDDGLMYYPFDGQGPPKGTSYPQSNALLMFAIFNHRAIDGNPAWEHWIDLLAKGLNDVAIRVADRAFYPMQAGVDREHKWHLMNLEDEPPYGRGERTFAYDPLKEPYADAMGYEGAARAEENRSMAALARHYRLTGNRKSLDVGSRLMRFTSKPGMWVENLDQRRYPGWEHGIWSGHFHNGAQGLCGLIDVATILNDERLMELCREGYESTRRNGLVRIGFFPAWSTPERYGRAALLGELTEPCALADMIVAAVLLSDAGLGDYWDDVDCIVRNHLLEQQVTDLDELRKITGIKPGTEEDARLQRFRGGFGCCSPTSLMQASIAGCCTANGAQGYYYAWHGITRCDNGVAKVNLFLNRASPWMDIDSYLPFEGRVVLHNKTARTAIVRVPAWGNPAKFECRIERDASEHQPGMKTMKLKPAVLGHSLVIDGLQPRDRVVLEFALPTAEYVNTIAGKRYRLKFRGNTVVDIQPHLENPKTDYQLYQRQQLLGNKAPLHEVERFVADKTVPPGSF
jgi:hypothetical protein